MRRIVISLILCAAAAAGARAQGWTDQWVPYTLKPQQVGVRVWASAAGDRTHARVTVWFSDGGYRVVDWGAVQRQGNALSVDIKAEDWTGGSIQMEIMRENFYDLGALAQEAGRYSFTVRSYGSFVARVEFDPSQIVERWEESSLDRSRVRHAVWTDGDVTFASACLSPPDDGYRVVSWGEVVRTANDFSTTVRLERWTGGAATNRGREVCRVFLLGAGLPPDDTFTFTVRFTDGVAHSSFPFTPARQRRTGTNPVDSPSFFVRQHYLDFFGREPDADGLNFWYNEVAGCGYNPDCIDNKRNNTSGAFYLSVEFQETGYLVYRLHKAAFGGMPRFERFMADTREVGAGVVVNAGGWRERLEANTRAFVERLVARPEFAALYPQTLTPEQYVRALDANTAPHPWSETEGGVLSPPERDSLANGLRQGTETRATVLRKVAEAEAFRRAEFNRAFVMMQYFGYLRRDPDPEGLAFWLRKLEDHGGDYIRAEMVRSFIVSGEYRSRFGQ